MVPISPELIKLLQQRFEEAHEGEDNLLRRMVKCSEPLVKRWSLGTGVKPWKQTWQTLRASCKKDWAMHFPRFAVSEITERGGFEPPVTLLPHTISSRAPSAARPPLQTIKYPV